MIKFKNQLLERLKIMLTTLKGLALFFLFLLGSHPLLANTETDEMTSGREGNSSIFAPRNKPGEPRNYVLSPIISLLLPGFDQWWEGQYLAAGLYSTTAILGYQYAALYKDDYDRKIQSERYLRLSSEERENERTHGEIERKIQYGQQIAFAAGSFSAYHSFRTAVTTQQQYGKFAFLNKEETPLDLLASPFHFRYLKQATTIIPLGIIAALHLVTINANYSKNDEFEKDPLTKSDMAFTLGTSYNAGTHEEALFRGFLMPVLHEWMGNGFWSNTTQALVFASAHLNTVKVPLPQLALGWHLGWVTQKNEWQIGEAVFIHTWWNVFAFLSTFQVKKRNPNAEIPPLLLPPLEIRF